MWRRNRNPKTVTTTCNTVTATVTSPQRNHIATVLNGYNETSNNCRDTLHLLMTLTTMLADIVSRTDCKAEVFMYWMSSPSVTSCVVSTITKMSSSEMSRGKLNGSRVGFPSDLCRGDSLFCTADGRGERSPFWERFPLKYRTGSQSKVRDVNIWC